MAYQNLKLVFKYAYNVVETCVRKLQPDYILTKVEERLQDGSVQQITSQVISNLAGIRTGYMYSRFHDLNSMILCTYNVKGNGPFVYKIDDKNPSFPPKPPTRDMIPVGEQIIFVDYAKLKRNGLPAEEKREKEGEDREEDDSDLYNDPEDMTDLFISFAGPDGLYHGNNVPDLKIIIPQAHQGDKITITFASGNTTDYVF
jgi:hypothetical protein